MASLREAEFKESVAKGKKLTTTSIKKLDEEMSRSGKKSDKGTMSSKKANNVTASIGKKSGNGGGDNTPLVEHKYGWGSYHPEWLQKLNRPWFLLVCLSYLAIVQGFAVNGIVNAVSPQLERRFHMMTDEIGLLSSIYDASHLVMMFPLSYWGPKSHKGRWIGLSSIVLGLGSFVWVIPHFAAGTYKYGVPRSHHCFVSNGTVAEEHKDPTLRNWKYMFFFGQILHGLGASPFHTLGITYIDENVSQRTSTLFVGIYHASSLLGPTVGYLFAGWSMNIYGDIDKGIKDPFEKTDPRWYGAWWIGLILSGAMALLIVPLMLGFPRQLPGAEKARQHDVNQQYQITAEDQAHVVEAFQNLPAAWWNLKTLLKNPTYLGLVLEQVATLFVTAGVSMFLTKFIQTQYSMTTSQATYLAAGAAIPSAFGGTLLGTMIQRRLHLHCYGNMVLSMASTTGAVITCAAFFFWCATAKVAGINTPYPVYQNERSQPTIGLEDPCNANCTCTKSYYQPTCYEKQEKLILMFSPCYAGCRATNMSTRMAWNCSCLPQDETVKMSLCESRCPGHYKIIFMVGLALLIFFVYMKQNPVVQSTLRCVPFQLRTFALAAAWVPMRAVGALPSTPVVGAIIKATCLLWQESKEAPQEESVKEVCVVYDNPMLATYILEVSAIGFAVSFAGIMFAWRLYKPPETGEPIHVSETGSLEEAFQVAPAPTEVGLTH